MQSIDCNSKSKGIDCNSKSKDRVGVQPGIGSEKMGRGTDKARKGEGRREG